MLRTSWHVTAKSSILPWGVLYKSGVYARTVLCLTSGGLRRALGSRVREKLAEGGAIRLIASKKSAEGIVGRLRG
jgi:hypothetical protein